ncbi:hypothetical protein C0W65_06875 [Bacillus subtilis]|nr:hypothetical protein C0W65_06875 [Bacillus subtilis]
MDGFKNFVVQIITFYIFNNRLIILIKSFKSKKSLSERMTLEENSKREWCLWGAKKETRNFGSLLNH